MSKGEHHSGRKGAYHSGSMPVGQSTLRMLELIATVLGDGTI